MEKIINYPTNRQSTEYSCGVSSVQSAIYFCKGFDKPETFFYKKLDTNNDGTPIENIVQYFKENKIKIDFREMTIDDLKNYIDNNVPVIMPIQAWGKEKNYQNEYKEGHYVTAIGYNDEGFIFEDPSISNNLGYISFSDLDSRWHDKSRTGIKYDHYGIAIKCNSTYNKGIEIIENYLQYLFME